MTWINNTANCGMAIYRLGSFGGPRHPEVVLTKIFRTFKNPGLVVFSDNTTFPVGRELAAAITAFNLGPVTASAATSNPNTDDRTRIQAWVWAVDRYAFAQWGRARGLRNRRHGDDYDNFGRRSSGW
jgi:hypothetical protein